MRQSWNVWDRKASQGGKAQPFETILVWKLNRFSRSRADSITYKTLLRVKGIDVVSINEPVYESPTGRLIEGVIESMEVVEAELQDPGTRLGRLYDDLETGKLDLMDLAPRIKEMRQRQSEVPEVRAKLESEMTDQGVRAVDDTLVKAYAEDLQGLLEESRIIERKAFVCSFVDRIDVDRKNVTVHYKLPLPTCAGTENSREVLPIITSGGANRTFPHSSVGSLSPE